MSEVQKECVVKEQEVQKAGTRPSVIFVGDEVCVKLSKIQARVFTFGKRRWGAEEEELTGA